MMTPDKRKAAIAVILGKVSPKPEEPSDDGDMGLETAMDELMAAFKRGDAKAAAVAFRSAHEQCCAEPESESEMPASKSYDEEDEDE